MVCFKVKEILFCCISVFFLVACENAGKRKEEITVDTLDNCMVDYESTNQTIEESDQYACRKISLLQIINKLQKHILYIEFDSSYSVLSKNDCMNLNWINRDHITEFYEFTNFTEAYRLKLNDRQYLILMGQPAGATGIGTDYYEYKCYEYCRDTPIFVFSSLYAGPFAIFYNKEKNNIGYWELAKEFSIGADSVCSDPSEYEISLSVFTKDSCIYKDLIGR